MEELKQKARTIRKHILEMLTKSASGHPGGSLSSADIITYLYFKKMNYKKEDPNWPDRDRLILSKGHACPAQYAALAEAGFFSKDELKNLRKINSMLQGHPDIKTPGIEISTGALGQGLSIANGIALAGKLDKKPYRTYCIIGDGECQEGQIWEAAMTAAHHNLDNVTAIIDNNRLQIDGKTCDVKNIEPIADKFRAFGWRVLEIDGHDFKIISEAFEVAEQTKNKPTAIIANTIKGKGISFMENQCGWHGKAPSEEECNKGMCELT